jgi:hypothetical protein
MGFATSDVLFHMCPGSQVRQLIQVGPLAYSFVSLMYVCMYVWGRYTMYISPAYVHISLVCMYSMYMHWKNQNQILYSQAKPSQADAHVHSSIKTLVASSILCISEKFPDRVNSFILTVRGYDSVRKSGPEKNLVGLMQCNGPCLCTDVYSYSG